MTDTYSNLVRRVDTTGGVYLFVMCGLFVYIIKYVYVYMFVMCVYVYVYVCQGVGFTRCVCLLVGDDLYYRICVL